MRFEKRKRAMSIVIAFGACSIGAYARATDAGAGAAPRAASVFDGTIGDRDPIPEMSTAELQIALRDNQVLVLDARPFAEFAVSHLPGARSVPGKPGLSPAQYTADVGAIMRTVPDRSRAIVLYCNGLFCGRSKRFGAELSRAGYQNVRRYQLGIPAWRALGGVTQVEKDALVSLLKADGTAVLVDARDTEPRRPHLPHAKWIPLRDTSKAKDDGRLPMSDHNTRIFVVGDDGAQSREVAEAIVHDAFHNVSFFDGNVSDLPELVRRQRP